MLDNEYVKESAEGFDVSYQCGWNDLSFEDNADLLQNFEISRVNSHSGELYFMLERSLTSKTEYRLMKIGVNADGEQFIKTMGLAENTYRMIVDALYSNHVPAVLRDLGFKTREEYEEWTRLNS